MAILDNRSSALTVKAREIFTSHAAKVLPDLAAAVMEKLSALVDQPASAPEMQERRDAWMAFQSAGKTWANTTNKAWISGVQVTPQSASTLFAAESGKFELIDNEVMENKILASRLGLRILDVVSWELNDLRLRVQNLDRVPELEPNDTLRPDVLARQMLEQWTSSGLSRNTWLAVQDVIQNRMAEHLLESYHITNEFLVQQGVMAEIDLRPLVKRTPSGNGKGQSVHAKLGATHDGGAPNTGPGFAQSTREQGSDYGAGYGGAGMGGYTQGNNQGNGQSHGPAASRFGGSGGSGGSGSAGGGYGAGGGGYGGGGGGGGRGSSPGTSAGTNGVRGSGSGGWGGGSSNDTRSSSTAHEETRMQTATTPLAKAKMRAQGVMGGLMRLLTHQVVGYDNTRAAQASPQLAQAMSGLFTKNSSHQHTQAGPTDDQSYGHVYGPAHVEQASTELRQRTSTLKKAATTSAEKATIEIVALMFQSILAEDRIPSVIRVWFARLQMPVLRVAISEPEFFGSLQHPARRLIDRMGSCVLGFDIDVTGSAMEIEIKRVVQVIEQYPETGRRVFQLVYDEFQKFLSKFLSENGSAARVVSIAQQVEQKETMAIQYTIEMRNMLNDMPVREEIREFLFKIWAEVLAIAAMRNGPQHEQTITLKRCAADLVWAASAKPNRADRAKVIADLPKLLQLLRLGMSMLGMDVKAQDDNIKIISDTLADAFMSKTGAISPERIEAMTKRLTNLEDYLSDEDVGDLPLDTEALVMMIGIDASDIEVVTDGGSHPTEAMRAWAAELQLGAWFSLDHNGRISHVQFAWRSDRKQLHLFASADGRNFLIQARRLAAYLQAGLLLPTEEEALTVRATRNALAKLEANPERLLGS